MAKIAAIFDLDDTLLNGSSGRLFFSYLRRKGLYPRFFRLRNAMPVIAAFLLYHLGQADVTQTMQRSAMVARGIKVDELWEVVGHWFEDVLVHAITQGGRDCIAWHREQGHVLAICSASSQFAVQPVADHLGIEHAIYTEWLSHEGRLTGQVREPIVYGAGKVHWASRWAAKQGVALAESYFYSDHISDEPLLEVVASPVAVNPEPRLARLARSRNWPILDWRTP
jgi:HAD superfamily hydrolase (TIGR01490 family)